MKKTILFTTPSKRINYLGINLITEVKDLYTDNYKTLMKITEDDTSEKIHGPVFLIGHSLVCN